MSKNRSTLCISAPQITRFPSWLSGDHTHWKVKLV